MEKGFKAITIPHELSEALLLVIGVSGICKYFTFRR